MKVFSTAAELREALHDREIAFVPTMGYLHDGHASLIRVASTTGMTTVVSIFVNPTQFNDPSDLAKYPRDLDRDVEIAEAAGCAALFVPDVDEIYPPGDSTRVVVAGVTENFEGKFRPGHFDGVATVVAKLFLIVQPNIAFFGEKDWQQCCVVARMIRDLHMPIELAIGPTIREPDGLAMSSRNVRLTSEQRRLAPSLFNSLQRAATAIRRADDPARVEAEEIRVLRGEGFSVDYFCAVDAETLLPRKEVEGVRILAAASLGEIRLIDNIAV
jgi:pantoate--beta-alanine ligase